MENFRLYGEKPIKFVLVHGGPGAPGGMAPVARVVSEKVGVLEPFQTKKTIAGQIEELREQIENYAEKPVTILGWSWGAWLVVFLASKYPELVEKLILVSSGPFEAEYAKRIMERRYRNLSKDECEEAKIILDKLYSGEELEDKDEVLSRFGYLMTKADFYDELPHENEVVEVNGELHQKIWDEAAKMRESGELLEDVLNVKCPLTIIQGKEDSHPYEGLSEPLEKNGKKFKMILIERCGHYPWYEKYGREEFFRILGSELD